jgi:hypothetical protein
MIDAFGWQFNRIHAIPHIDKRLGVGSHPDLQVRRSGIH